MKTIKITSKEEIDIKRFYLPIEFKSKCPKCGTLCKYDYDNYISEPILNSKEQVQLLCKKCDDWFDKDIIIRMEVDIL